MNLYENKHYRLLASVATIQNSHSTWNRNYVRFLSNSQAITNPGRSEEAKIEGITKVQNTLATSSEELLEKMIAGLSTDLHQKRRVYKNDLLRVLAKVNELNFSTKKQGLLLIRCCSELLPDEAPSTRITLVEQVWKTLE